MLCDLGQGAQGYLWESNAVLKVKANQKQGEVGWDRMKAAACPPLCLSFPSRFATTSAAGAGRRVLSLALQQDPGPIPTIPSIPRSPWLWLWLSSPPSSSPSCSSCSTSAGTAPSSALTVSPLFLHRVGAQPWGNGPHGSPLPGTLWGTGWQWGPAGARQGGQQLLIHSWNGFSLQMGLIALASPGAGGGCSAAPGTAAQSTPHPSVDGPVHVPLSL